MNKPQLTQICNIFYVEIKQNDSALNRYNISGHQQCSIKFKLRLFFIERLLRLSQKLAYINLTVHSKPYNNSHLFMTFSLIPRPLPLLRKLGDGLVCDVTRFASYLMNIGGVNHNPLFKSCRPHLTWRPRILRSQPFPTPKVISHYKHVHRWR